MNEYARTEPSALWWPKIEHNTYNDEKRPNLWLSLIYRVIVTSKYFTASDKTRNARLLVYLHLWLVFFSIQQEAYTFE